MSEKRHRARNLCADLLKVRWKDESGVLHLEYALLDDISAEGASLKFDQPIVADTEVTILYPNGQYRGTVKYCIADLSGYLIGVGFAPGYRWSQKSYNPAHLLRV
jgi:hypothetical protein